MGTRIAGTIRIQGIKNMIGEYIEYNNNIYKVLDFSTYDEAVNVKLIVKNNTKLCSDKEHIYWLSEGKMWPEKFFRKAKVIYNGKLLYEDK